MVFLLLEKYFLPIFFTDRIFLPLIYLKNKIQMHAESSTSNNKLSDNRSVKNN